MTEGKIYYLLEIRGLPLIYAIIYLFKKPAINFKVTTKDAIFYNFSWKNIWSVEV